MVLGAMLNHQQRRNRSGKDDILEYFNNILANSFLDTSAFPPTTLTPCISLYILLFSYLALQISLSVPVCIAADVGFLLLKPCISLFSLFGCVNDFPSILRVYVSFNFEFPPQCSSWQHWCNVAQACLKPWVWSVQRETETGKILPF